MSNKVYVIGVGMTKFEKPGRRENWDYPDMARESGTKALEDAGIDYAAIEQGYVGYVYGESTSGQRALYELGLSGIPIVNLNNNCSTGSTALYLPPQPIRHGLGAVGRKPRPGRPGGGGRRANQDPRLRRQLRRHLQGADRLPHECASRSTCLRPIQSGPVGLPGDRVARLLLGQRALAL